MKNLLIRHFCGCKENKCARVCFYCLIAYLSLPLEHGMWEWTGTARFLPLVGLHI